MSYEKSLELLENIGKHFIIKFGRIPNYHDEPRFFHYYCQYGRKNTDSSGGTSYNDEIKAKTKAIGEAIERFSSSKPTYPTKFSTFKKIKTPAVTIENASIFSNNLISKYKQLQFDENSEFSWTKAKKLSNGKEYNVPTQFASTSFLKNSKGIQEPLLRNPISTGSAGHFDFLTALLSSICEIIERDSCTISYLKKIELPHILPNSTPTEIKKIFDKLLRYKLKLTLLDATSDFHIPTIISIIEDISSFKTVPFAFGSKSSFNTTDAIIGAIEESLVYRTSMRNRMFFHRKKITSKKQIKQIRDHGYFWYDIRNKKFLDFWLSENNTKEFSKIKNFKEKTNFERMKKLKKILTDKNLDTFFLEITHSKIKKSNYHVLKCIIPVMQPLYFNENFPSYSMKRIEELPKKLGYKFSKTINPIPHPFL